jgi:N-acetylmuramoyl-L-alanine amidase
MTPAWKTRAAYGLVLLAAFTAHARQLSRLTAFEQAEHLRQALEDRPESQRSRAAYDRVLDAYRAIYHNSPAAPKADASVLAVAQLLTEEGGLFSEPKMLHDAMGQYAFLRVQYPGNRYGALIAEGEKQTQQELNTLHRAAVRSQHNAVLAAAIGSQQNHTGPAMTPPAIQPQQVQPPSRPPPAMTPPAIQPQQIQPLSQLPPSMTQVAAQPNVSQQLPPSASAVPLSGRVSLVSGIRHWSTPVYTRIAIDLQDQVPYQAARVPGPDRIFFDLYGARLAPELNGKSVEVVDDGFLKRIRIAQFSNNVTRVVLDVSSVSDYSAFLLPNPWRLIIDIHGLKPGATPTTNLASLPATAAPAVAVKPPVVNTPQPAAVASAAAGPRSGKQEIAALGQQPNRVQATAHPTTKPIVAAVAGTVPAPQADDGSLASTAPASTTPASTTPASTTAPSTQETATRHKKPSPLHPAVPASTDDDDSVSPPTHEATPTAAGERSLVRTLGLKIGRIVIDAGHGGHDSGTTGPGGIEEKEVVLDVALRLGKLLRQRLGADVIYTRDNDTFIPLETRTAIANKAQADLFLSIHANSSPDSSARGVETYYLNFTTSPDALEVAARENAVSDESIHELSDLVKKITLKDKIDESREFAADVQKSLYDDLEEGNPGMRDRGVKKAPFVVLIGANMPSILAEISFLTNSADARELQQPAYRERIAESLYRGVSRYISGLSGVRLAQSAGHPNVN